MDANFNYLFRVLEIVMIDIVLSFDNMGVIALAIRNLPKHRARLANIIGVAGAILLRILFASAITKILLIEWLPVRLIGGLLLLDISWNLINLKDDNQHGKSSRSSGFWIAVYSIIAADFSVSLDNALAIGGIANGDISLIIFGLLLNIPLIFFGSQLAVKLIKKYKITIFIGGGFLINTALEMILEDRLVASHISKTIANIIPWAAANLVFIYGFWKIHIGGKRRVIR
jgi:YjbE family integral membrane protein